MLLIVCYLKNIIIAFIICDFVYKPLNKSTYIIQWLIVWIIINIPYIQFERVKPTCYLIPVFLIK